jgi:hypothetical protein
MWPSRRKQVGKKIRVPKFNPNGTDCFKNVESTTPCIDRLKCTVFNKIGKLILNFFKIMVHSAIRSRYAASPRASAAALRIAAMLAP